MLRCIRSLSRDPRSAAQAHRMRPRQTPTRASLRSLLVDWALGLFSQLVYLRVLRRRVGARLLLSASLAATLCVACITRSSVAEDPPPPVDAPSTDVASVLAPFFSNGPLSAARQDFDRGRWQQAADAFSALDDDARKSLSTEELQAFQLMHGFALLRAGHSDSAKTILAALASENTLYTDYANALAARAALELGDFAEAMRLAAAVSNDAAISSWARCTFSIADLRVALSPPQKTVIPNAIDRLLLLLPELDREHSRMARLAIAQAQETLEQKLEAATLYQKLIDEAPNSSEGKSASTAIELLLPQLDEKDRARFAPPPASPFDDAMAHYNAHRSEKAIEAFLALRKKLDKKTTVEDWCRASFHIAKSHTKLREHSKAKGYYQETIDNCADNEWQLKALYNGGLAYWNANEKKDAIAVFERLIKDYPSSNLADDAYFFIARIQLEEEKTQAAHDSLEAQLAAYPAGDMAKDARWLLFSHLYAAGQFDEAIAYVDTHAESTDEDDVSSRGRLAYFRARALEQSKRLDQAQSAYAGIVEAHPGDYFAALAFARLSAIGADKASELSTRLRPAPADLSQRLAQLQDPKRLANASYQRAIAFSRMGRYEWVEAEAKRAGDELGEQDSIPWLMLALQEQLGAVKASHRAASLALGDATSCLTPTDCERWALAYPRPFASLVEEHASKQQLSTELVYGIMREESGFDPRIESYANARGLMQLMLPTAESTASSLSLPKPTAASLFEPETAIPLGVGYLAKLASLFGGNEGLVMAGYNGGQGAVGKWLEERPQEPFDLWVEGIPYGQTRHYVKRVLSNAWTYRWLYEAEIQASFDPATPVSTLAGLP